MDQGFLKGGWRDKYFIAKNVHDDPHDKGKLTGIKFTDPEAQYFVMRFDQDPYARVGMRAYAEAIKSANPQFSADILAKLETPCRAAAEEALNEYKARLHED